MTDINVHSAQISSASVSIRMIHVDNRKLTMATFRQIPNACVLRLSDLGFVVNGTPWGWVEYRFDGNESCHLHVLWQDGQLLRRSALFTVADTCTCKDRDLNVESNKKEFDAAHASMIKAQNEFNRGNQPWEKRSLDEAIEQFRRRKIWLDDSTEKQFVACRECCMPIRSSKCRIEKPPRIIKGIPIRMAWVAAVQSIKESLDQLFIAT